MKLDVNTPVNDLDGKPLKVLPQQAQPDASSESKKPPTEPADMVLADILIGAALTPSSDRRYKQNEHVVRYQLALSVNKARKAKPSEVNITAEEATLIKEDIEKLYAPLISGQVLPMLDGK